MLILTLILTPLFSLQASTLDDAYKGIVKIYTYYESTEHNLIGYKSGSGVVINYDGVILTNNHVISKTDINDEPEPIAYKVCLTKNTTEEPECLYTASLMASDEDKDLALLKIKGISGISTSNRTFNYLERLATTDNVSDGELVQALGYPGFGGDTITITTGTVSGATNQHSFSWIKTDAVIGHGSSGGALINTDGKLVGITTAAYSDFTGSMGYAVNINSVNKWINDNIGKNGKTSSLQSRMENIITKQKKLETSNTFTYDSPNITLTKPDAWEFTYTEEGSVIVSNAENDNGGRLTIGWPEDAVRQNIERVDYYVELLKETGMDISAEEYATIDGQKSKKIIYSMYGEEIHQVFVPSENYIIIITYYLGEDNVDNEAVNQMLDNLEISASTPPFAELKNYTNSDPYFELKASNNWSFKQYNSETEPLAGSNSKTPQIEFTIYVVDLTDSEQKMTNQKYFDYVIEDDYTKDKLEMLFDTEGERYYDSVSHKINNELTEEIMYKYEFVDEEDEETIKNYAAVYLLREDNKEITIEFFHYGDDKTLFEQYLSDFEDDVLSGLTLGREVEAKQPTDDNNKQPGTDTPVIDQITLINNNAKLIKEGNFDTIISTLGLTRNTAEEQAAKDNYLPDLTEGAMPAPSAAEEKAMVDFIVYGCHICVFI